jgi:pyruvate/2-oxoglutarate dehydrogenase complex dihydrolipoamide dehydrogenase (E3) component
MAEGREGPPIIYPWDRYNQELVSQVHPPDWRNPQPAARYNLVVVGGGTAGLVCAAGAAGLGARVALVERHLLGGDCLNYGCVPSKAMLSAARMAAAVRDAGRFGVRVPEGTHTDFAQVMERMRRLRSAIAPHDSASRFRTLGVDVFIGDGAFVDGRTIEVSGARLHFKKALIATGARPAAPPIPGLEQIDYLTNESVFSLTELPRRLGIVGAGPIGCELAQAFARFGSEVILIENRHGLLPKEDREAAQIAAEALAKDGVRLLCCGKDLRLSLSDGKIRLRIESHDASYDEVVDRLLVAAGRAPNVEGLELEKAGVEYDRKGVRVNDFLQTSNPHIYAAGDICSSYQFTHAADFMARLVIRNALFFGRARLSSLTIPWCTYTDPEIAQVGLSEQRAKEQGIAIDSFTRPLTEVDRAVLEDRTDGFVRIHLRKGTDRILGATVVAANAGDMIAQITQAMTHRLGLKQIADTICPYPTQAEAIRQVGDLYNRTRLTPLAKALFSRLMAWQR